MSADDWSLGAGLTGRGVLVTGATGAIGREVARAFAAVGARVAAVDLDAAVTEALAAELPGGGHLGIASDLREADGQDALVAEVERRLGSLDVLAHVAAVLVRRATPDEISVDDFDLQSDVNLRATLFLDRAAARAMRARGRGGRIVNFASQGWWSGGYGGSVAYAATKGGVVSLSRGLARTYAADRITVNCVAPGLVDTPMLRDGLPAAELDALRDQVPIGRLADPAEIAPAVVFLASAHAAYITGATLNVSGGQLMY